MWNVVNEKGDIICDNLRSWPEGMNFLCLMQSTFKRFGRRPIMRQKESSMTVMIGGQLATYTVVPGSFR